MSTSAPAPSPLQVKVDLPETLSYRLKNSLLGPALTTDQLAHERLSNRLALGVLSSDCISSSAYGSEEMLLILLPVFGIAAFTLLLPITFVILAVLLIVTLTYRDVVMLYTKAGGSYVVARDNFGPTIAQIAAVALMLDYVVTVAVQAAAGTAAVTSAIPTFARYNLEITVGVVLILFYGNLRGLREAGRLFALPTYLFIAAIGVVIVTGLVREAVGDLPHYDPNLPGAFPVGPGHSPLSWFGIFVLLKSFANGGSSLTGLEAISNGVSAFKRPEGVNARKTLVVMSCILGSLVLGVSWLAHETHAPPFESGTPTVISQVAKAALGPTWLGHAGFLFVQFATMLILYTGANTPFNGFPFLTSFVAEDQFLPRQLTKRGHRLAFSNGIIVLAICSLVLLIGTGAHVDKLVAFYAIGVFTGFTMAGFGMAKHFHAGQQPGWRKKVGVNLLAGSVSLLIVLIFAVVKFTEGAWLVLVLFPIMMFGLVRLNRRYRREAKLLASVPSTIQQPNFSRSTIFVLVDEVDLATLRALRYSRSLRPTELRVVHFMIDSAHAAELHGQWDAHQSIALPLEIIDCPDRRLARAAAELAAMTAADGQTQVTVLLPRRAYSAIWGRLLHDHTADVIAEAVSKIPGVAATIVPFDVVNPVMRTTVTAPQRRATGMLLMEERPGRPAGPATAGTAAPGSVAVRERPAGAGGSVEDAGPVVPPGTEPGAEEPLPAVPPRGPSRVHRPAGVTVDDEPVTGEVSPIAEVTWRQRAVVEGRVRSVRFGPVSGVPALECEVVDGTGGLTLLFYGRRDVPGIAPGSRLRATGRVGEYDGHLAIANPRYELLTDGSDEGGG